MSSQVELAKNCLAMIRDIAARGADSQNPQNIGHALQELAQVMVERTGSDERVFEPIPVDQIHDLGWLHDELSLLDGFSRDLAASDHTGQCPPTASPIR